MNTSMNISRREDDKDSMMNIRSPPRPNNPLLRRDARDINAQKSNRDRSIRSNSNNLNRNY